MSSLPGPETLRESWCLLSLETATDTSPYRLVRWVIGDGNADDLIRTTKVTLDEAGSEGKLLAGLGTNLVDRRYEDTTLITLSERDIAILRSRFLTSDTVETASLRGFYHVALRSLLSKYFDEAALSQDVLPGEMIGQGQGTPETGPDIETLWETRKQIGTLVPADALRGSPL